MVGRAKDEDAFDVIGPSHVLIGPCCSGSAEVQSCMWADEGLDSLGMHLLLGTVDVLRQLRIELSSYMRKHLRLFVYHSPACRHCLDCFSIILQPIQIHPYSYLHKLYQGSQFGNIDATFDPANSPCRQFA